MSSLRVFGTTGGGSPSIPQYPTDPISPAFEDAWVLHEPSGTPVGLLLALTSGTTTPYLFSYFTLEGTIKRVELT